MADPTVTATAAPKKRTKMKGKIVDATNGMTLEGAVVVIQRGGTTLETQTVKKNGLWESKTYDAGDFTLTVSLDGYGPPLGASTSPGDAPTTVVGGPVIVPVKTTAGTEDVGSTALAPAFVQVFVTA